MCAELTGELLFVRAARERHGAEAHARRVLNGQVTEPADALHRDGVPHARAAVADDAISKANPKAPPGVSFRFGKDRRRDGSCARLICQPEVLHAQAEDPPGRVGRRL